MRLKTIPTLFLLGLTNCLSQDHYPGSNEKPWPLYYDPPRRLECYHSPYHNNYWDARASDVSKHILYRFDTWAEDFNSTRRNYTISG